MNEPATPEHDDLDDLLRVPPPAADTDDLRDALRRRTQRVLRRRRYARRLGLVVALAACYLAGLATMRIWMPPAQSHPQAQAPGPPAPRLPEPAPRQAPIVQPPEREVELSAAQLERQGELAARDRRCEWYRRAGDLYLEAHGDAQSALRCYRLALESASEKELVPAPEDNWLLISLKSDRQKEKRHVPNDS